MLYNNNLGGWHCRKERRKSEGKGRRWGVARERSQRRSRDMGKRGIPQVLVMPIIVLGVGIVV